MNEFYLDPASGKKLAPRQLEQEVSSNENSKNQPAEKVTFKEILKSAAKKTESSPEIRHDMVDKYKASLANGTYEVKAEELAEKMIQKIRENKTRNII